jgi:hypothetical protein
MFFTMIIEFRRTLGAAEKIDFSSIETAGAHLIRRFREKKRAARALSAFTAAGD